MKVLVLSDSHGNTTNFSRAIEKEGECKIVFFLGDGANDLEKMKKEYEKPIVELVEFEVSDAIAGTCQSKVQTSAQECVVEIDPEINFSHPDETCTIKLDEGYCYYSPNDINSTS